MKTQNTTLHSEATNAAEAAWWRVRGSLLATLAGLSLVFVAMVTPTPLGRWVFGEAGMTASLALR